MGQIDAPAIADEECLAKFMQLVESEWLLVENAKYFW
jgi:hypothetical protein